MSDVAIRVEGLGKEYRIGRQQARYKTIRETIVDGAKAPFRRAGRVVRGRGSAADLDETIWALKDVSFEVKQGEVVGVIGRNGAGKTTLLKILSRITEPTAGDAWIHGRVGSLLEVGTGFHPELTGRENVYLNGAILGMRKNEIDRKFDEIVDFSGIEKFIDTPVKHYSSGMYVRLAFSVAAHMETEILLVDEVLAVGDAKFQKKCLGKMKEVSGEGRTVLFVSHNMGAVSNLCPRSLWLEAGESRTIGETENIILDYLATSYSSASSISFSQKTDIKGQIKRVRLLNEEGHETSDFRSNIEPLVEVIYVLNVETIGFHVACIVSTDDGSHLFSTADTDTNPGLLQKKRLPGEYKVQVQLPTRMLNTGSYHIAIGLGISGIESFDRQDALSFTKHDTGDFGTTKEGTRRMGLLLIKAPWKYVNGDLQ